MMGYRQNDDYWCFNDLIMSTGGSNSETCAHDGTKNPSFRVDQYTRDRIDDIPAKPSITVGGCLSSADDMEAIEEEADEAQVGDGGTLCPTIDLPLIRTQEVSEGE